MGLKEIQIYLDNPSGVYNAGQTITGKVKVRFDTTKKVRGIEIQFKGAAHTSWEEKESYNDHEGKSQTRYVTYSGDEEYFDIKYYLVGSSNSNNIELSPGEHIYPFTCALPPTLPSSFEGDHGHVRYTVKVTLDRPWKFDQTSKIAFTVISHVDLNYNERVRKPATLTMEKYFCCCWCKSGPLTGVVKVPYTGFVSGQIIPLTIEIDNASDQVVSGMRIELRKKVTYYSRTPKRKTEKQTKKIQELNLETKVEAHDSQTWNQALTVPALPPSNLVNCSIIDLDYEIKFEMEIEATFHRNMTGKLSIIIGTVPLVNLPSFTTTPTPAPLPLPTAPANHTTINMSSNVNQPLLGWNPTPGGAPPVDPSSLPPPTYEECQFGTKSIQDKNDSEHTILNRPGYNPMYPVYNFNTAPTAPPPPYANPYNAPYPDGKM